MEGNRKLIKLLLLMIIIQIGSIACSQSVYFNNRYYLNQPGIWSAAINAISFDEGYLIAGTTGDEANQGWHRLGLLKIDTNGNILDVRSFGDTIAEYYSGGPGSFFKMSNAQYFLLGSKNYYDPISYDVGMLVRLNLNLDTLWTKEYKGDKVEPIDSTQILNQMDICSNNDLILVGSRYNYNGLEVHLLIRTDSLGNPIWERTYGTNGSNRGYSVIQTSDGGFAIGGFRYTWGQPVTGDAVVIKTDSLGNEEWIQNIGGYCFDDKAMVCLSKDGHIIAATARCDSMFSNYDAYKRIRVIKMDNNGNIIWDKSYGRSRLYNFFSNVRCFDDGSIVVVGSIINDFPHESGWALKLTSTGDSLWYREYDHLLGNKSENHIFDIIPTSDNGYLACGWIFPMLPDTGIQDAWIIKLDSIGCDTPGCDTTVAIPEIVYENTEDELYIYPNPARYKFQVTSFRFHVEPCIIEFYDVFGRKVKEIKVPKGQQQLSVDVSNWHNGLYVAVLKNDKKFITKQKFVVLR